MSERQLTAEERKLILESPSRYAAAMYRAGKFKRQIERDLINNGVSPEEAQRIVQQEVNLQDQRHENEYNEDALRNMAIGGIICVIGIVVTVISYQSAANSPSGGSYVIAWGAVIFGGIQFLKGWADR